MGRGRGWSAPGCFAVKEHGTRLQFFNMSLAFFYLNPLNGLTVTLKTRCMTHMKALSALFLFWGGWRWGRVGGGRVNIFRSAKN